MLDAVGRLYCIWWDGSLYSDTFTKNLIPHIRVFCLTFENIRKEYSEHDSKIFRTLQFIHTSLRDESEHRPPLRLKKLLLGQLTIAWPADGEARGDPGIIDRVLLNYHDFHRHETGISGRDDKAFVERVVYPEVVQSIEARGVEVVWGKCVVVRHKPVPRNRNFIPHATGPGPEFGLEGYF